MDYMPEPSPPIRRIIVTDEDLSNLKPSSVAEFHKLDPAVRYLWIVSRGIMWVVLFGIILFLGFMTRLSGGLDNGPAIAMGVTGLAAFATIHLLWPFVSYRYWGYALRRTDILLRYGVIWKRVVAVPFARIQHVDSDAGPLERSLGMASLVIHTAGSQIGSISIPGLPEERAEALRDYLSKVGHTHANL